MNPIQDAPPGKAWKCPDCRSWATLGGNAAFHAHHTGHGDPTLVDQPKPRAAQVKSPPSKDTQRLKTLIDIFETGSSDFEEELFFAQRKTKTAMAAYRRALDRYHRNHA